MARQRIGGNNNDENKVATEESIILASLKERPKLTSKLFDTSSIKTPASQLSLMDRDYHTVAYVLKNRYQGSVSDETNIESIKVIGNFFQVHYKNVFGMKCIDYNWFNFLKVMEGVMTYFQFKDFIELADFICRSFVRFTEAKKSLNLTDKILTLSTFRQTWILDELENPSAQKFTGFY